MTKSQQLSVFTWLRQLLGLRGKDGLLPEETLKQDLVLLLGEFKELVGADLSGDREQVLVLIEAFQQAVMSDKCSGIAMSTEPKEHIKALKEWGIVASHAYTSREGELIAEMEKLVHQYTTAFFPYPL